MQGMRDANWDTEPTSAATADRGLAKAVDALARWDESSREDRARRLIWAGQFNKSYGMVVDRPEKLALLHEAQDCFTNGHFIAVLIAALAFIEQTLVGEYELKNRAHPGTLSLGALIAAAKTQQLLPEPLLDDINRLRQVRNPFVHSVAPGGNQQQHRLAIRASQQGLHPESILTEDAELAIRTMFACRDLTMRAFFETPQQNDGA